MDVLVAQSGPGDPKHTSTTVVHSAKYQTGLDARKVARHSAGVCDHDPPNSVTVSTECRTKSTSESVTNAFSPSVDFQPVDPDISPTSSSTPVMTIITTSSLPILTVSQHSDPVVFSPPTIPLTSIITSTTSVIVPVTSPTIPMELSSVLGSTSNAIQPTPDGIGPYSTTHFSDAISAIPSVTKNATFPTITTSSSLSSNTPTGSSSGSNSSLHPVLSKAEILGIFIGVGFAIVIAAISAFYVYRHVRASKSNTSSPSSNPIIDDTHTIRSRNAGSIDPYRIEEYLRTSWHEDVATLRKFNMNGP